MASPLPPICDTGGMNDLHVIIPAGGAGTRLWPLSRRNRPKFLLDLAGTGRTLLQGTVDRLKTRASSVTIVTGQSHRDGVLDQLPEFADSATRTLLIEPSGRDSMAAIGLAAYVVRERYGDDAIVGSFAADHLIARPELLHSAIDEAVAAAAHGSLQRLRVHRTGTHPGRTRVRRGRGSTARRRVRGETRSAHGRLLRARRIPVERRNVHRLRWRPRAPPRAPPARHARQARDDCARVGKQRLPEGPQRQLAPPDEDRDRPRHRRTRRRRRGSGRRASARRCASNPTVPPSSAPPPTTGRPGRSSPSSASPTSSSPSPTTRYSSPAGTAPNRSKPPSTRWRQRGAPTSSRTRDCPTRRSPLPRGVTFAR